MSNYLRYFINKHPIFITMVIIPEKYYPIEIPESMKKRNEKGIWQRRYYDHVIRDEKDLCKHIDYIHFNSMKYYNIAPKNWQFSSFDKYVKNNLYDINWCNLGDKIIF